MLIHVLYRSRVQSCSQHRQQDPHRITETPLRDAIKALWPIQASDGYVSCVIVIKDAELIIYIEGDVDGIMEKPEGSSEEEHRAREKWYRPRSAARIRILNQSGTHGNNRMASREQRPRDDISQHSSTQCTSTPHQVQTRESWLRNWNSSGIK